MTYAMVEQKTVSQEDLTKIILSKKPLCDAHEFETSGKKTSVELFHLDTKGGEKALAASIRRDGITTNLILNPKVKTMGGYKVESIRVDGLMAEGSVYDINDKGLDVRLNFKQFLKWSQEEYWFCKLQEGNPIIKQKTGGDDICVNSDGEKVGEGSRDGSFICEDVNGGGKWIYSPN